MSRVKNRVKVDKFSQNQAFRAVNRRVDKMRGFTMCVLMVFEGLAGKPQKHDVNRQIWQISPWEVFLSQADVECLVLLCFTYVLTMYFRKA